VEERGHSRELSSKAVLKQQQQETFLPEKYPNMATKAIKMPPFENWTWSILGTVRIGHTSTTE
jgi:hypothetical protein